MTESIYFPDGNMTTSYCQERNLQRQANILRRAEAGHPAVRKRLREMADELEVFAAQIRGLEAIQTAHDEQAAARDLRCAPEMENL